MATNGKIPQATSLNEVPGVLLAEPLLDRLQLESFRVEDYDEIRGLGIVPTLMYQLTQVKHVLPYKALVSGRTGCGKSTELAELKLQLDKDDSRIEIVKFDVVEQLDPLNFQPFDILLVIVESVIARLKEIECALPDPVLAMRVSTWFDDSKLVSKTQFDVGLSAETGAGSPDWWDKLTGFFAKAKGEAMFAAARERTTVQHALNRLDELVDAVNAFLRDVQAQLDQKGNRRLLLILEGFDKREIPRDLVRQVFLTYGTVLRSLDCSMILTIPLDLLRSGDSGRLPPFYQVLMCDIPVYDRRKASNEKGREWLREILSRRMEMSLFEEGQAERAIVASGGIIRLLFRIVNQAAVFAGVKKLHKIDEVAMTRSINSVRDDFEGRLGSDKEFGDAGTHEAKLDRLVKIYDDPQIATGSDDTFASLLKIDAVLGFNGDYWYGLHPLAVEALRKFRPRDAEYLGGTI